MIQKKIWALLDERQGNTSQTLGVAEALGLPFEIKKIEFNHFIRIPNIFINKTTVGVSKTSLAELQPPWPDIVISTARRLGIVASYIKSKHPSCFIAEIQWPGFPSSQFDLIAAPKHDGVAPAKNIITTVGAPHRVSIKTLLLEAKAWQAEMSAYPSPRIAVLVGGSTQARTFSAKHAGTLAKLCSDFARSLGGSLLVTTSRRTSKEAIKALKGNLNAPHYLHIWDDNSAPGRNPFYGFLGLADVVISTGDSISMCSEACATGKPVYIYTSDDFASPKHQSFIRDLFDNHLAKPLEESQPTLFQPVGRLDDSSLIASEIRKRAF